MPSPPPAGGKFFKFVEKKSTKTLPWLVLKMYVRFLELGKTFRPESKCKEYFFNFGNKG